MNRRRPLIWTLIVFFTVVAIIIAGCISSLSRPGWEEVQAGSDSAEWEPNPVSPSPGGEQSDDGIQSGPVSDEPKSITVGKRYTEALVEEGSKNILIIGEDKVSFLYDTIGIISVHEKSKTIKIIMIPRDTYIEYNEDIIKMLEEQNKADLPGIYKINFTHHIGVDLKYEGKFETYSASFLADVINEKFGVEVDDYIKVNLDGFVEIVDAFGGVDINVPYDMHYDDPIQDLHIHIDKGMQHLDGKQAEGFARFRQGYREDGSLLEIGDDGRKTNQINLIKAIIKQHGTLSNIDKLPKILGILGKNVKHSIGIGDALQSYIVLAKDLAADKYEIEGINLNSKQIRINGSSYIDFE